MPRIVFVGAGSLEFTFRLARDVLTYPRLREATLVLHDIDAERLEFARRAVTRLISESGAPARVEATLSRQTALEGADAVLCTILVGSTEVWRHDIEVPKRFGIDLNVGDTRGPAGIFRALRTIPVLVDIARDLERLSPRALLLNYTNPMSMLCAAVQRSTKVLCTGLCHSVQGTAAMLARWLGVPYAELTYRCAGLNHLAWFLELSHAGRDQYPALTEAVLSRPEVYAEEMVRNELFLALGRYVTESSGHNSEYNWWFRKRPELVERYCTHGTGWNPGEHAYILSQYQRTEKTWRDTAKALLDDPQPLDLARGGEYAAGIIEAFCGGAPYRFNGNVPNHGLLPELPAGACVEVPVVVDRDGLHPIQVGRLPAACLPLTALTAQSEDLAVEGALTGKPELIFQAVAYDPLTAAVLSLAEIRDLVNALFEVHRSHLPQFQHCRAEPGGSTRGRAPLAVTTPDE
ncbi:MAG: alpha-glucosidase/alpha-galactosidase [Deltaproteobacteria bacterium RIFOXYA12_FULL_61_11]|nr:MAG: alpha-glucosidase/alpha-galactosidase [Deltaproteobacteria bacterium RIFOXYA12_FULL_61_11]